MTAAEVLQELESLGSEQTRKTYRRHGITGPQFGVSYADLDKLVKRIKVNHELAVDLWASGNHDARILATKIADAGRMDSKTADAWVTGLDNRPIVDAFASLLNRAAVAQAKMKKWTPSKNEWTARTGWCLVAGLAGAANDLPDAFFEDYLGIIEKEIHSGKNYVREAMNSAVIAIGLRNEKLRTKAIAAAKRIGRVEVDHGDTACKTPDAVQYIEKTLARRAKSGRS